MTYRYTRHLLQDSPNHPLLAFRALRSVPELLGLLRRERFDVLHAHTRGAFMLAVGLATIGRRPMVFTNHGYARRRGMYRWGAGRRRLTMCVLTPNMARHYGLDPRAPNLRIISACCADDFFTRPTVGGGPVDAPARVRLIGLGNIVGWKNWHLVLEAMAQLPERERRRLEFQHWGPVPGDSECVAYEASLKELLARYRLQDGCCFRGLTVAVHDELRQAHWFVLPSTNEPCSVALIEALALGLPAVVSASGGNVDIVQQERTGLMFEPDHPRSLAACLGRIARGEASMAPPDAIRETVRLRGATAVAGAYLEVYRQFAGR
jgi:glycosyltransferase involved in cell wall biosynthesis